MAEDTVNVNNRMLWIGGGILLSVGVGISIFLYRKKKKEKQTSSSYAQNSNAKNAGGNNSTGSGFCKYGNEFPLRYGSCGKKVILLQKILHLLGADLGSSGQDKDGIDGKFGNKTQAALLKYSGKKTASYSDLKQLKMKKR